MCQVHSTINNEDIKAIEENAKKKNNAMQCNFLPKTLEEDAMLSNQELCGCKEEQK